MHATASRVRKCKRNLLHGLKGTNEFAHDSEIRIVCMKEMEDCEKTREEDEDDREWREGGMRRTSKAVATDKRNI